MKTDGLAYTNTAPIPYQLPPFTPPPPKNPEKFILTITPLFAGIRAMKQLDQDVFEKHSPDEPYSSRKPWEL